MQEFYQFTSNSDDVLEGRSWNLPWESHILEYLCRNTISPTICSLVVSLCFEPKNQVCRLCQRKITKGHWISQKALNRSSAPLNTPVNAKSNVDSFRLNTHKIIEGEMYKKYLIPPRKSTYVCNRIYEISINFQSPSRREREWQRVSREYRFSLLDKSFKIKCTLCIIAYREAKL